MKDMKKSEIVEEINKIAANYPELNISSVKPNTFSTKGKAIARLELIQAGIEEYEIEESKKVRDEMDKEQEEQEAPEQKPLNRAKSNRKEPSKSDKIRKIFSNMDKVSRGYLAALIGSDARNTHTLVSILCNPERTKDPLSVRYNKEDKTYSVIK